MRTCKKRAKCHPDRPLVARGLCNACWKKDQESKRDPSKCHPNKPEYIIGSGVCNACYSLQRLNKHISSKCHPSRPEFVVGSGVCKACHTRAIVSNQSQSKCHPNRPEYLPGSGVCEPCYQAARRSRYQPSICHPDTPEFTRGSGLCRSCYKSKERYGIVIDYPRSLCEICSTPLERGTGKSAVDHDHSTGFIRGLLCGSCNKMLGFAKDSPSTLSSAIKYLYKYSEVVFKKKVG